MFVKGEILYFLLFAIAMCMLSCDSGNVSTITNNTENEKASAHPDSPVAYHGALQVQGNQILNEKGQAPMLAGPSFFWSNTPWQGAKFYRENVVNYFVEDWNASVVRAAIGVKSPGGYLQDKQANLKRAEVVIDAAIKKDVYVILDWHSHDAETTPQEAKEFFTYFANKYGAYDNIIYEIYNEPLRATDWKTVIKPYSIDMIKTIRAIDPDNLIIVGSQSWDQDVDKTSLDPINGFSNIAYSMHFYAGTHKEELRQKTQTAIDNGLAIIVSEWGGVNANGDGNVDIDSVTEWMKFMRKNKLSHANWSVSDKREGASIFKPDTDPAKQFSDADLTRSGLLVKKIVQEWK